MNRERGRPFEEPSEVLGKIQRRLSNLNVQDPVITVTLHLWTWPSSSLRGLTYTFYASRTFYPFTASCYVISLETLIRLDQLLWTFLWQGSKRFQVRRQHPTSSMVHFPNVVLQYDTIVLPICIGWGRWISIPSWLQNCPFSLRLRAFVWWGTEPLETSGPCILLWWYNALEAQNPQMFCVPVRRVKLRIERPI